jgi:hypothetical protein
MSGCDQIAHLSSARLRWAPLRKNRAVHKEESDRSYRSNYFEAVMTRHEAAFCAAVIDLIRKRQGRESFVGAELRVIKREFR